MAFHYNKELLYARITVFMLNYSSLIIIDEMVFFFIYIVVIATLSVPELDADGKYFFMKYVNSKYVCWTENMHKTVSGASLQFR